MDWVDKIANWFKQTDNVASGSRVNYVSIIQDLQRFRGSALADGDHYDFPNHVYFKILFHFNNNTDAGSGYTIGATGTQMADQSSDTGSGLLHPTWLDYGTSDSSTATSTHDPEIAANLGGERAQEMSTYIQNALGARTESGYYRLFDTNSAWAYLVLNKEIRRARDLQMFIELLSNINSNTPWYFQEVKGLDAVVNRGVVTGADFNFPEERNKITISCLEDAYDMRLSTLMDLYRSVVWSWETKRSMLPSNLRKFDMTIIAFQAPIRGRDIPRYSETSMDETVVRNASRIIETEEGFAVVYDNEPLSSSQRLASYKAWELHGCEFDYNSMSTSYGSISNTEGTTIVPEIGIYFDDCYEIRFNEFLGYHITDLAGDTTEATTSDTLDRHVPYGPETGFVPGVAPVTQDSGTEEMGSGWLEQAAHGLLNWGEGKLKRLYLGNLYGISLSRIRQQLGNLDNLGATFQNIRQYAQGNFDGNRNDAPRGDLFPTQPYPSPQEIQRIKRLGNLHEARTLAGI